GTWGPLLGVLAAVTMTLGNLLALRQRDAVRLLAWSSVAQSGYMLAPLAGGSRVRPHEWMTATAAYVAMYAIMNIGAFAGGTLVAPPRPARDRRLPRPRPHQPGRRGGDGVLPRLPGGPAAGCHGPVRQGGRLQG